MKQSAVELLTEDLNYIKSSSTKENGKITFLEKEFNKLIKKHIERQTIYNEIDLRIAYMSGHKLCKCVTENTYEALESFEEWVEQYKNK